MKISFVIPAYNEEAYIGRCLGAICQAREASPCDVEIIVVNNASTDRTGEVAQSFAGVTVVEEPQKGLVRARSAGLERASGEIIANIDADTAIPAGWIGRVLDEFGRDSRLVCASGPFVFYDVGRVQNALTRFYYWLAYAVHCAAHALGRGALVQGGNFVVRRDSLVSAGGFDTRIEFYGEDTDIARRMRRLGKVKFSFGLFAYSSARRLQVEGVTQTALRYAVNYFWILFFKRPFHNAARDIR